MKQDSQRTLIFTETSGYVYSQFASLTVPLMRAYAARVGADFLYDHQELKAKYPLFRKYKVGELLAEYDRVLFLDIDILVRPDSPNLFGIVPSGHFAAFNEGAWCEEMELEARQWHIAAVTRAYNLEFNLNMALDYFNAGVFLADRQHVNLFEMPPENPVMSEVVSEQSLLNIRIKADNVKTYHLPICFNSMPRWWSRWYLHDSYFIHHAGGPVSDRLETVARDLRYIQSNFSS